MYKSNKDYLINSWGDDMYKEEIKMYLKQDIHKNINIINFMENYPINYIKRVENSVILKGKSDRYWVYISSSFERELKIIKSLLSSWDRNFAVLEEWMIPILIEEDEIKWKLSTMKYIFPDNLEIKENDLETLTLDDVEYIYYHSAYRAFFSKNYISERIRNGLSACVRIGNKLAAWAMTQDDGAIGFLQVLPEFRRKGYAKLVSKSLISKIRKVNKIPYVQIEEDNIKSISLAKNLGFKKDRLVSWIGI